MEVILKQDVEGLGKAGSVVKVKDGHALNYLIPRGLALLSTSENLKNLESQRERKKAQLEKLKAEALRLKEKLEQLSLTIPVLAQEDEKLYATVTAADIARVLKEENFEIEKNVIVLDEPIKSLGIYEVLVKLHPEVSAKIKIWIVKK